MRDVLASIPELMFYQT